MLRSLLPTGHCLAANHDHVQYTDSSVKVGKSAGCVWSPLLLIWKHAVAVSGLFEFEALALHIQHERRCPGCLQAADAAVSQLSMLQPDPQAASAPATALYLFLS